MDRARCLNVVMSDSEMEDEKSKSLIPSISQECVLAKGKKKTCKLALEIGLESSAAKNSGATPNEEEPADTQGRKGTFHRFSAAFL